MPQFAWFSVIHRHIGAPRAWQTKPPIVKLWVTTSSLHVGVRRRGEALERLRRESRSDVALRRCQTGGELGVAVGQPVDVDRVERDVVADDLVRGRRHAEAIGDDPSRLGSPRQRAVMDHRDTGFGQSSSGSSRLIATVVGQQRLVVVTVGLAVAHEIQHTFSHPVNVPEGRKSGAAGCGTVRVSTQSKRRGTSPCTWIWSSRSRTNRAR